MRFALKLLVVMALSGCAANYDSLGAYMNAKGLETPPSPQSFGHCHGYGCKFITEISLDQAQWKDIERHFSPAPETPEKEREAIKLAIAEFEKIVGHVAGTDGDIYGTFQKLGTHQLDCVDESTNSATYLSLLKNKELLRYHDVLPPSVRLPLIHAGRWPHQTAVIVESESGEYFAVDSWFHDNGAPPEIILLKTWKEGWKPQAE